MATVPDRLALPGETRMDMRSIAAPLVLYAEESTPVGIAEVRLATAARATPIVRPMDQRYTGRTRRAREPRSLQNMPRDRPVYDAEHLRQRLGVRPVRTATRTAATVLGWGSLTRPGVEDFDLAAGGHGTITLDGYTRDGCEDCLSNERTAP